jgi:predicted metal-dependent hydrolase
MEPEPEEAVRRWARLFDEARYYEAHEVAEAAWFATEGPSRDFFKGLVHAAVSLCHWQRQNAHGGRVKCASAIAYLQPYAPAHRGMDVAALVDDLARFGEWMGTQAPGAGPLTFPDPPPRVRWVAAPPNP